MGAAQLSQIPVCSYTDEFGHETQPVVNVDEDSIHITALPDVPTANSAKSAGGSEFEGLDRTEFDPNERVTNPPSFGGGMSPEYTSEDGSEAALSVTKKTIDLAAIPGGPQLMISSSAPVSIEVGESGEREHYNQAPDTSPGLMHHQDLGVKIMAMELQENEHKEMEEEEEEEEENKDPLKTVTWHGEAIDSSFIPPNLILEDQKSVHRINPRSPRTTIRHFKSTEEDPWGALCSFDPNPNDWFITEVTAGEQFHKKGVRKAWKIVKVDDHILNVTTKDMIQEILEQGSDCTIEFEVHEIKEKPEPAKRRIRSESF